MPKDTKVKRINQYRAARFATGGNAESLVATETPDAPLDHWLIVPPECGIALLSAGDYEVPDTGLLVHDVNGNGRIAYWDGGAEQIRLGDLEGNWGYTDEAYGIALGEYAASKANLVYDPTNGLRLRIYDADYIQLSNAGDALISGKLQLKGADSALAIGATPPTAADAGTGLWLDRMGLYGLAADVLQFKVDAATGALVAGAGAVQLDSTGLVLAIDMTPSVTDTYDLGSIDKWWRSLYASTINSTVFSQNVQQVLGGSFLVPKGSGTLPAVGNADVTIDFGVTMTPDDHILVKSYDASGTAATEYIKIGSLVSGTTYNVTRDEASAHATDPAWPDGTPYAVLGQDGNGWINLDALTTPRISILSQGANYNDQTEVVRLGDINGLADYTAETYGLYIGGKSTGVYLTSDATNGLRITDADSKIMLDGNGMRFYPTDAWDYKNGLTWYKDTTPFAKLYATYGSDAGLLNQAVIEVEPIANLASDIYLLADSYYNHSSTVSLVATSGGKRNDLLLSCMRHEQTLLSSFSLGSDINGAYHPYFTVDDVAKTISYTGNLRSRKNDTYYTGYIYVPLATPATSASWDGDTKISTDTAQIDLQTVFGLPAGIKAVVLYARATGIGSQSDRYFNIRTTYNNGATTCLGAVVPTAAYGGDAGIVNCDANGDIGFACNAASGTGLAVTITIIGYYI